MMRDLRSERGSLPVAMLTILVVGSVATMLVGTVVTGQRQTGFDQGFEQSLQVAETGLERMRQLVESGSRTDDFSLPESADAGGRYTGVADRDGRDWELTATGTAADGTSRTVTVTLGNQSVFGLAAFGRTLVELRGNNTADSYDSRVDSSICADGVPCHTTGHGVVATNEELSLHGNVINEIDRAEIHYARENIEDPLPGATGFCGGVPESCASSKLAYFREPIELQPDPVVPPADLTNQGSFAGPVLPAGRQLYTNVTLGSSTVIQGTAENPSVIYLTGTLNVGNHEVVNFETTGGTSEPRPSTSLLIFSAGIGPALRFGNHASFSGAVFAPRATFSGGAAGDIYGSIMTGSISTHGSWNFHYDDALGEVETEATRVTSGWSER